jgi:hypothetical protein
MVGDGLLPAFQADVRPLSDEPLVPRPYAVALACIDDA